MKVIDILNTIVYDKEHIPKKIKIYTPNGYTRPSIWVWDAFSSTYECINMNLEDTSTLWVEGVELTDKVEIIEL